MARDRKREGKRKRKGEGEERRESVNYNSKLS
jgi:hypothetical protein